MARRTTRWLPTEAQRRFLRRMAKYDGLSAGWEKPSGVAAQLVRAGVIEWVKPNEFRRNLWRLGRFEILRNKRVGSRACAPDDTWKMRRQFTAFVGMNIQVLA